MAFLDDVQAYLIAQGQGTLPNLRQAWPIYLGYMPDDMLAPNRLISIYEISGSPPEGQWNVIYPRLTVHVRGETDFSYTPTRTKIQDIFSSLHNTLSTIGADYRSFLGMSSAPIFLGYDTKTRPVFMWTFQCIKQV